MDTSSNKPAYSVQTIAQLARIRWRPGHSDHILSCSSLIDTSVHVWNVTAPSLPFASFTGHTDVVVGILWNGRDQDTSVISCGKNGVLLGHGLGEASRPLLDAPSSVSSWAPDGSVASVRFEVDRWALGRNEGILAGKVAAVSAVGAKGGKAHGAYGVIHLDPSLEEGDGLGGAERLWFSPEAFEACARGYVYRGLPVVELCARNARVASAAGLAQVERTWWMLQVLFTDDLVEDLVELGRPVREDGAPGGSFGVLGRALDYVLDPTGPALLQDTALSVAASADPQAAADQGSGEGALLPSGFTYSGAAGWAHGAVLRKELMYLADNGDVQTCVAVALVLGEEVIGQCGIDKDLQRQWLFAYVDQLHRFQLFCEAADITRCAGDPQVKQMSQQSTTVHTSCSQCSKPLLDSGLYCGACKRTTGACSLCLLPVRGPFAWCQGCGHGGHLDHCMAWFAQNSMCPSGCGHKCLLSS